MFIIEGNIGAGKTTLLNALKKEVPNITTITEPVNKWLTNESGQSLLQNFYKKPARWAYTLENLAMLQRVHDHISIQNNKQKTIIMERSIYSGHYCFAKNSFETKNLTDLQWEVYSTWTKFLHKKCLPPKGFIYLQATPQICMNRIKKRNRTEEKTISLSYIEQINKKHEMFLLKKQDIDEQIKTVPVLTLNANLDINQKNRNVLEEQISKIKHFITTNNKT